MSRHWTLLLLATLPLLSATAGAERDCTAYGWSIHSIIDSRGNPDPYRFAIIYRLRPDGVAPIAAQKGLPICPGDILETWHGATTTLVRGNNVASVVAEGGSVIHFSDRIVQRAGTVTYLMPSGWSDSIEALLVKGALLVANNRSTVQVSMSGPSCDPIVEVSVSPLDDPFLTGSPPASPMTHSAQLTIIDAEGRPQGVSLELLGNQSARLTPNGVLPDVGGPLSESAREVFERSEPLLRAPLAKRGPPTAQERESFTPSDRQVIVFADEQPDALLVNGLTWAPWGWLSDGQGDGMRWVAERQLRLPPGESLVEVTMRDGRYAIVTTTADGDVVVDMRAGKDLTPTVVLAPCGIVLEGAPTGLMYKPAVLGLDMYFVELSSGQFCMGSPDGVGDDDERPQHPVKLGSFMLGESEVTQSQWRAVVEAAQASGDMEAMDLPVAPSFFKGERLPVERVSWCDALRFANVLSRLDDRTPVYEIAPVGDNPRNCTARWVDGTDGYRLPTAAEWEFAARSGTMTAYATGDAEEDLARAGWYGGRSGNSGSKSHEVCTAPEMPWGLCDLHGNVWEWVWDGYSAYSPGEATNPRGQDDEWRVSRGGSWNQPPKYSRSADQAAFKASNVARIVGFRLALSTPGPS